MIIRKMATGHYICRSPISNISYEIVQSHEFKSCYVRCCFGSYCRKFNDTRKPLLKYFGIDKSCAYFFQCAGIDDSNGSLIYFRKLEGGV